jgi:L-ascorbate metabolism protein UlaG (beta-lactamase superfamily)
MKLTYYGQSTVLIETANSKILFDPFITPNPMAKQIDINSIKADFIFVTHGHADHVADLVAIAKNTDATIVCLPEVQSWVKKQCIEKIAPVNTGGTYKAAFGWAKCVVAHHSSSMPDGSYGGNPIGYIFHTEEGDFYFAGDTALTLDMQLIPRWIKTSFAILPIGDNYTMGYEDASVAAEFVQTKKVVGVHYDTFPVIAIDHQAAQNAFTDKGIELLLPQIGETIEV